MHLHDGDRSPFVCGASCIVHVVNCTIHAACTPKSVRYIMQACIAHVPFMQHTPIAHLYGAQNAWMPPTTWRYCRLTFLPNRVFVYIPPPLLLQIPLKNFSPTTATALFSTLDYTMNNCLYYII